MLLASNNQSVFLINREQLGVVSRPRHNLQFSASIEVYIDNCAFVTLQ